MDRGVGGFGGDAGWMDDEDERGISWGGSFLLVSYFVLFTCLIR